MVTYGEFKKAFDQLPEMKKNIANFKSKLIDLERGLFGTGQGADGPDSEHTCAATLEDF